MKAMAFVALCLGVCLVLPSAIGAETVKTISSVEATTGTVSGDEDDLDHPEGSVLELVEAQTSTLALSQPLLPDEDITGSGWPEVGCLPTEKFDCINDDPFPGDENTTRISALSNSDTYTFNHTQLEDDPGPDANFEVVLLRIRIRANSSAGAVLRYTVFDTDTLTVCETGMVTVTNLPFLTFVDVFPDDCGGLPYSEILFSQLATRIERISGTSVLTITALSILVQSFSPIYEGEWRFIARGISNQPPVRIEYRCNRTTEDPPAEIFTLAVQTMTGFVNLDTTLCGPGPLDDYSINLTDANDYNVDNAFRFRILDNNASLARGHLNFDYFVVIVRNVIVEQGIAAFWLVLFAVFLIIIIIGAWLSRKRKAGA